MNTATNPVRVPDKTLKTSEIAEILGVSQKMVMNWIDSGRFGWKIPGSTHRRAWRSEVVQFAKANKMTLAKPEASHHG